MGRVPRSRSSSVEAESLLPSRCEDNNLRDQEFPSTCSQSRPSNASSSTLEFQEPSCDSILLELERCRMRIEDHRGQLHLDEGTEGLQMLEHVGQMQASCMQRRAEYRSLSMPPVSRVAAPMPQDMPFPGALCKRMQFGRRNSDLEHYAQGLPQSVSRHRMLSVDSQDRSLSLAVEEAAAAFKSRMVSLHTPSTRSTRTSSGRSLGLSSSPDATWCDDLTSPSVLDDLSMPEPRLTKAQVFFAEMLSATPRGCSRSQRRRASDFSLRSPEQACRGGRPGSAPAHRPVLEQISERRQGKLTRTSSALLPLNGIAPWFPAPDKPKLHRMTKPAVPWKQLQRSQDRSQELEEPVAEEGSMCNSESTQFQAFSSDDIAFCELLEAALAEPLTELSPLKPPKGIAESAHITPPCFTFMDSFRSSSDAAAELLKDNLSVPLLDAPVLVSKDEPVRKTIKHRSFQEVMAERLAKQGSCASVLVH